MSTVITVSNDKLIKDEKVLRAYNLKVILASKLITKSEVSLMPHS